MPSQDQFNIFQNSDLPIFWIFFLYTKERLTNSLWARQCLHYQTSTLELCCCSQLEWRVTGKSKFGNLSTSLVYLTWQETLFSFTQETEQFPLCSSLLDLTGKFQFLTTGYWEEAHWSNLFVLLLKHLFKYLLDCTGSLLQPVRLHCGIRTLFAACGI